MFSEKTYDLNRGMNRDGVVSGNPPMLFHMLWPIGAQPLY